MPKQHYTIRDWSGGINNRQDPRDIQPNESAMIEGFSVDSLGKLKTLGGLYDHKEGADGTTDLSEYIVERTANIVGSGGYGLFYFESDYGRDPTYTITDTKHPGTSNDLALGTGAGNINFTAKQQTGEEESGILTSTPELSVD